MGDAAWTRGKRWYALLACAAVLVAAVVVAVASARGGTDRAGGRTGADRGGHPTAGTGRTAWTPDPHGGDTYSGQGVLRLRSAPNIYYLPRYSSFQQAPSAPEFHVVLTASSAPSGDSGKQGATGKGAVGRVEAAFDLTAFQGRAEITSVQKGYGCVRSGYHVNCALGSLKFGEGADFTPFSVRPKPGTAAGPAGTVTMTVRGANAPTVRHTTRVISGSPRLTARPDLDKLTEVPPGGRMRLTPAFGNKGDTAVEGGISVVVSANGAGLLPRYANCRYDKATGATKAQCDFPGPLPAGAAYETDGPLTAVADRSAKTGTVTYTVWRTADVGYLAALPASAPHGSGAPLRLRSVDGSAFTGDGAEPGERAVGGGLSFETTGKNDVEAVGFTIRGRVGQVVEVTVPYPRGDGWTDSFGRGTMWVTLPAGVSLIEVPPQDHESDIPYCHRGPRTDGPVACPGPAASGTVLRVRLDRRVDGAHGSVSVRSDASADPDRRNNTAPVTVQYLP
ncbi:hypothetical protein H1R13_23830 [Streptomyces mexicanus]|uniref:DUF11 domain-containing protein n=1 Tax=Streptomyces mexicanus TaxID=178566 RepID=A0A7X1I404_9ACTN|nr:hypothetical protein [Streptomyces mexicanus]MBC2867875.1 hypothetical protein [Streptomyces mexicanus]